MGLLPLNQKVVILLQYLKEKMGSNPNEFLGKRQDLHQKNFNEIAKKFKENGATILGGCCETGPAHIKAIAKIK